MTLSTKVGRMTRRAESAAATRLALVAAAAALLDEGGRDAVTLRAVGTRAGVSRGAVYGHFDSKEEMLGQLALDGWATVVDILDDLRADTRLEPAERIERVLLTLIDLARRSPHRYAQMFCRPEQQPGQWQNALRRVQERFLAMVADLVGEADARRYAALLFSATHGIADLSGPLSAAPAGESAEVLVHLLLTSVQESPSAQSSPGNA